MHAIIVGVVYRPNTAPQADMDIFMNTMQEIQNILNNERKEVFIMGDMNMDLLKINSHAKTHEYINNIFSQVFIPLITKPTRVATHTATLIDHIYYKQPDKRSSSGILKTDISDHFGIFSIIKTNKTTQIKSEKKHIINLIMKQTKEYLWNYCNRLISDLYWKPMMLTWHMIHSCKYTWKNII